MSGGPAAHAVRAELAWRARAAEFEQIPRLDAFREQHPDVRIREGAGYWQAVAPCPEGESVITRYTLRELMDKLDEAADSPDDG